MRTNAAHLALVLALCGSLAQAQWLERDPDWKEAAPPPPPAVRTTGLIPIEMRSSVLRWGVDPASISLGADGVVRYVVVARSDSGTVSALYEGLRCNTAESTVYARSSGDQWSPVADREWKPIQGSGNGARLHTLTIARTGACMGHGPNQSADRIARDLAAPVDTRFRSEMR
ncbi:CNP1-like family protein [Ramlibacter tataouinensis]|uniref:CNP1-like family protein n=1 Tax=Ramlibacter tataouinensis TaxID=94132 RepID=UPI0022F38535|nr:CNP1-like family protein [Ramlibacter tataouinensis]WBY00841.1 CNP1-like family protein [Ramlibacter tataouinensis]